ncbi:MAG TPA: hypothetical protein VGW38_24025 [Chloroflexota bacterium]|nr:hypothetical protein [Chloroflexota bacterium]
MELRWCQQEGARGWNAIHRHAQRRVAQAVRQQELQALLQQVEAGLGEWGAWAQWAALPDPAQHAQPAPHRPMLSPPSLQALRLLILADLDRLQR